MDLLMIAGMVIAGIILIAAVVMAAMLFVFKDHLSYTARGSKTLSPTGTTVGQALVVYDPGVSGAAKKAAVKIAGDLQLKGYTVNLTGVRNPAATSVSGYDVIVVDGPVYGDKLGSSVQAYLQNLNASPKAKIGVFATGTVAPKSNDSASMIKFVANLPANSPVKVKSAGKLVTAMNGKAIDKTSGHSDKLCSEFVSDLLK
jgi:menaquinone-dependent protoporphyrinogen IX oxidase